MHVHHFDNEDFAATLLQSEILHTHTDPTTGVITHTAAYLERDAVLIQLPGAQGGTVVQMARPGEVGQHEMARDALARGLIDQPQQPTPISPEPAQAPAGYLALGDVPQDAVDALNRVYYVPADVWADELMRTHIIQTDQPDGHAVAHMGIRDDGQPIVLVQAGGLFVIFMPLHEA